VTRRTVTCRLCGEQMVLPDAEWVEQVDQVDDWTAEHARARHPQQADLLIAIDPDPITDS
jgi:hypothetical protein